MKKRLVLVACGAVVGAAALGFGVVARAQAAVATAYCAGLQSQPGFAPELFVFNTTAATLSLDLVLRGPDGATLVTHPAAMVVPPYATGTLDLTKELAHAGPKSKAYRGVFSAALTGDAGAFSDQTVVVHAAQYFGSIRSPHGASIIRPLFLFQ